MSEQKRRLTKAQKAWCKDYEESFCFDPLIDDYHTGNMTFAEAAQHSLEWIRDHVAEHTRYLERALYKSQ